MVEQVPYLRKPAYAVRIEDIDADTKVEAICLLCRRAVLLPFAELVASKRWTPHERFVDLEDKLVCELCVPPDARKKKVVVERGRRKRLQRGFSVIRLTYLR